MNVNRYFSSILSCMQILHAWCGVVCDAVFLFSTVSFKSFRGMHMGEIRKSLQRYHIFLILLIAPFFGFILHTRTASLFSKPHLQAGYENKCFSYFECQQDFYTENNVYMQSRTEQTK